MDRAHVKEKGAVLFWFRRDLRLQDNTAFSEALSSGKPVIPLFIFDRQILDELPKKDRRVSYLHELISSLDKKLKQEYNSGIWTYYGKPSEFFKNIEVDAVFTNRDYEPYALQRDAEIEKILISRQIPFHTFKDQVLFEKRDIQKQSGGIYQVFTPYSKAWKSKLKKEDFQERKTNLSQTADISYPSIPSLSEMGFEEVEYHVKGLQLDSNTLKNYEDKRDRVDGNHTTNLSLYLRFGTISPREVIRRTGENSDKLIDELIWREFYSMILYNHPEVVKENFKRDYDGVAWRNDMDDLEKWKEGKTGYPMVDAGMRELNKTGYIGNRARMVAAGFLTKHLLIHWSFGESYFAEKLMDYDLSSNNGNWQWAAGTGCDAAPYFRIFNPMSQHKKFDPESKYVKKWVEEYGTEDYPDPMVDHKKARERALEAFKEKDKQ